MCVLGWSCWSTVWYLSLFIDLTSSLITFFMYVLGWSCWITVWYLSLFVGGSYTEYTDVKATLLRSWQGSFIHPLPVYIRTVTMDRQLGSLNRLCLRIHVSICYSALHQFRKIRQDKEVCNDSFRTRWSLHIICDDGYIILCLANL